MNPYIKAKERYRLQRVSDMQQDFLRRYTKLLPDNYCREDFQRELFYLINLTYREAQEPLIKQLTDFVLAQQIIHPPIIIKDFEK